MTSETPYPTRNKLFLGSCFSLIATSVCFAVVGGVMGALKQEFILSNTQVGLIGGAALWGFSISIIPLGLLCDTIGMKNLLRFAFLCHLAGALIMIFATGFWMLFCGALVLSLGNGTVEAACNPLVVTLYPEQKTRKLNHFHVWFPGGIVIGGLLTYAMDKLHIGNWQWKIALIIVPAIIYGILMLRETFPQTERVQKGITFTGMVKAAFLSPLFWALFICMGITASLELGPNRWVPAVLESGGMPGILVLVYITGLMAVLRQFAGPVIHKLSPVGVMLFSSILTGASLYWMSSAETLSIAFASATFFAVGACYMWPTMIGIASERIPESGALGLGLLGGMGMLVAGAITSPMMGKVADQYLHEHLPVAETASILQQVSDQYPLFAANVAEDVIRSEILGAKAEVDAVLEAYESSAALPKDQTAAAMRSAITNAPLEAASIKAGLTGILGPSDNYGGRMSFRYVAPFAIIPIAFFAAIFLIDKRRTASA